MTTQRDFGVDVSNEDLTQRHRAAKSTSAAVPSSSLLPMGAYAIPQVLACKPPIVVSVEAAIGTGKSSLLRLLQQHRPNWRFVQEPVDQWQNVGGKHNLLQAFYGDKLRYAFSFQTYCVLSRIESVTKVLATIPGDVPVVILERSWFSDRNTFGKMLREQNNINEMEWVLYDEWYQFAVRNSPTIHGHIYLECETSTCMARLRKRDRTEEVSVTVEYQNQLIAKHEDWLSTLDQNRVCRVNVDKDFLDEEVNCQTLIDKIDAFVLQLGSPRAES